ncbi:MAG: (2Fe-2S)-binding protein [Gammaproteobacteria bacterium]|nr:(2Fe-2S)-binding protein [Gammaproteobacteria bacterium]MDH3374224.1 (2Fe-2S)-binding protein [Gammaproteobacteria bacterium]MDH3409237.1 (2Fe-2S)-binding protein [Gammaproteobacteria bacterium]MDH3553294.1 (2Fe-2S)-binding protein [Gammaproteobacteria bacterium]
MTSFKVNGQTVTFDGDSETPLLWVLRDHLKLTGTKFSCGMGLCGACVVHLDGRAAASCRIPVATLESRSVTTIEGLAPGDDKLHAVQKAWIELDVAQCGYCQSGQIMAAVDFLERYPEPSDADIDANLSSMLCRCGTYVRIRKAIHRAAEIAREEGRRG